MKVSTKQFTSEQVLGQALSASARCPCRVVYDVSTNCEWYHIPTMHKIRIRQCISSYTYTFLIQWPRSCQLYNLAAFSCNVLETFHPTVRRPIIRLRPQCLTIRRGQSLFWASSPTSSVSFQTGSLLFILAYSTIPGHHRYGADECDV